MYELMVEYRFERLLVINESHIITVPYRRVPAHSLWHRFYNSNWFYVAIVALIAVLLVLFMRLSARPIVS